MVYAAQTITIITLLLWLGVALVQLLTWLYWIQVKEYRFDRFKVLLRSLDGKETLSLKWIFTRVVTIMLCIFIQNILLFNLLLSIQIIIYFRNTRFVGIRKPVFTDRMNRIIAISVFSIFIVILGILMYWLPLSYLIIGEILLILSPVIGVIITKYLTARSKAEVVRQASSILQNSQVSIVAITGSYGKSTTKELTHQMLSSQYHTLSSYKNHNTVFGLARTIIDELRPNHKYFVAEMGAYKRGEINEITAFVKPDISVITGIEPQHLELFGNMEDLKRAKFEIVESLDGGSAVINVSGSNARDLYKWAKAKKSIKVYTYALVDTLEKDLDVKGIDMLAKIVKVTSDETAIEINYKSKKHTLTTNIVQPYLIENLIASILVAKICDVSWGRIIKTAAIVNPPGRTSNIIRKGKSVIIDDSYNSTPKAFASGLDLLSTFGQNKYVLTPGIIELGEQSSSIHRFLGEKMKKIGVVTVFVTSKDAYVRLKKHVNTIYITKPSQIIVSKENALLIEGRIPDAIYKKLL